MRKPRKEMVEAIQATRKEGVNRQRGTQLVYHPERGPQKRGSSRER
ncbi:hypothetical protein V6C27_08425 [Peptococcaceae bacterium 1198_IL3148]